MMLTRSLIDKIVNTINDYNKIGNDVYSFQDIKIDSVLCNVEIFFKLKIIVFKLKNIYVTYDGFYSYSSRYIPLHLKYKDIKDAVFKIHNVYSNYKFFDGALMNKNEINKRICENKLFDHPFDSCCICYNNTNEITLCKHPICIICREKMIISNKNQCPICRRANVLKYFDHKCQTIYNLNFDELQQVNNFDIYQNNQYLHDTSTTDLPPDLQSIHMFELLMIREVINFNIVYPFLFTAIITHKLYINRVSLLFTFFSGGLLYFFTFYLNHNYYDNNIINLNSIII